jgi:hypothetical protein
VVRFTFRPVYPRKKQPTFTGCEATPASEETRFTKLIKQKYLDSSFKIVYMSRDLTEARSNTTTILIPVKSFAEMELCNTETIEFIASTMTANVFKYVAY